MKINVFSKEFVSTTATSSILAQAQLCVTFHPLRPRTGFLNAKKIRVEIEDELSLGTFGVKRW